MIYSYGVSMVGGTYHKKNNIPCQDSHHIVKCGNNLTVAAVADGLGSAIHSEVGSKIAATESVKYCAQKIANLSKTDDILGVIKESFTLAQNSIEKKAQENGHSINEYDTTLTLAIMHEDTLYYGHSGDSGIIALTVEGLYEQVTEQQRDDEGRVFCLYFKEKWEFKRYGQKVCSVLLATDGMLEAFFPLYIKNEQVNIHVTLAQFFMDNKALCIDKEGEEKITAQMKDFIINVPDEQVNDDKTIVVMLNTSIKPSLQPKEYYLEPDWDELKRKHDEEWKRKAYPHLFKEKTVEKATPEPEKQDTQEKPADMKSANVKSTGEMDSNEPHNDKQRKGIVARALEAITIKRKQ